MSKKLTAFYCFIPWIAALLALPLYWVNTHDIREALKMIALAWFFMSPLAIHSFITTGRQAERNESKESPKVNSEG